MEVDTRSEISTETVSTISLENIQAAICTVTRYKNKQNQYTVPENSSENKFSTASAAENITGSIQTVNNE